MTLIIDLILHVYLGHQPGSGPSLAAKRYPGNSSVLTLNTCFELVADVGSLLKIIVIDFHYRYCVWRVNAIRDTAEAESGRLWAQPLNTTQATWGAADERRWSRGQNLSSSLTSLRVQMERLPLLRYIGKGLT